MSTRDIRTTDEIIVNVGKKDNAEKDVAGRRKRGQPRPGQKPDDGILKRRVVASGINFYDMAQVANGSGGWIDTDFQVITTPDQVGDFLAPPPLLESDYAARDAELFTIPTANYLTKFRKISKGSLSTKYGVIAAFGAFSDALDNLTQWKPGGLVVSQTDLNAGLSVGQGTDLKFFEFLTLLDGQANVKITGTDDFAGPAVAFSPIPKMDVFLAPVLGFLRGRAKTSVFGDRGDYGELFLTFPRRFIINTADAYQGGDVSPDPATGQGMDSDTNAAISNWQSVIPGRGFFYDFGAGVWSNGATFPPAGTIGKGIGYQGQGVQGIELNGALLAVVKKGNSFFYFWTDNY